MYILRVCVHLLLIVNLNSKLFFAVLYLGDLFRPMSQNRNNIYLKRSSLVVLT